MPSPQTYDPYASTPYTAPAAPAIQEASPSPLPASPPPANGAVKRSGGVATMADGILRGFMQGRAMHQASQVMKLKKQQDDLQAMYGMASQNLLQMHNAGVDPQSKEYQQAKAAVDGSWNAQLQFWQSHVAPDQAGGKKSKLKQVEGGIMGALQSKDPAQVSNAWLQVAQKAGPPVYAQIAGQAGGGNPITTAMKEYDQLALAPNRTKEQDARFQQLQGFLEARGQLKPKAAASGRWVPGKQVLTGNLPSGAVEAKYDDNGNIVGGSPIDPRESDPSTVWYSVMQGDRAFYMKTNPNLRPETLAEPGSGRPGVYNYNPVAGSVSDKPIGEKPAPAQQRSITTTDPYGNPVTQIVPIAPVYRAPVTRPGSGTHNAPEHAPEVAPGLHAHPGTHPMTATEPQGEAETAPAAPAAGETHRREHPAAAALPQRTPEQQKSLDKHITRVAKEAGVSGGGYTFEKFSKDNQQKFNAVRAQELTINGKPGSQTDIGLRRATMNVFDSKDPDLQKNIAVAMHALDTYSKSSLSAAGDHDYNVVSYLKDSWMGIPTLQHAFGQLNSTPEGKVYLDNFFRAWTNAATIRSLQGTSGKPSQSMYAMLVNELPMVGVNISSKADAMRKIDMLQDDVDTAAETMPKKAKASLSSMMGKSRAEGTPAHDSAQHKALDDEIMGLLK